MALPKREKRPPHTEMITVRVSQRAAKIFRGLADERGYTQGEIFEDMVNEYIETLKAKKLDKN